MVIIKNGMPPLEESLLTLICIDEKSSISFSVFKKIFLKGLKTIGCYAPLVAHSFSSSFLRMFLMFFNLNNHQQSHNLERGAQIQNKSATKQPLFKHFKSFYKFAKKKLYIFLLKNVEISNLWP